MGRGTFGWYDEKLTKIEQEIWDELVKRYGDEDNIPFSKGYINTIRNKEKLLSSLRKNPRKYPKWKLVFSGETFAKNIDKIPEKNFLNDLDEYEFTGDWMF